MIGRRGFMGLGLAVAGAVPFVPLGTLAFAAREQPFLAVLADRRFRAGELFARQAEAHGLPVESIGDDFSRFWAERLHGRWQNLPLGLAGLTTFGPFICLQQLARDHGMKMLYQGKHRTLDNRLSEHVLQGPAHLVEAVSGGRAGEWPLGFAQSLAGSAHAGAACTKTLCVPMAGTPEDGVPLYSWLIVPRTRQA
ncbi:hypothetical protein [Azotobacter beijerinckii]|uniref:hypothetical protein n=1 Tax=Azotobacter beijerinckii TaxID=170623 RepID=UPI002953E4A2|nr:hypothetical protein [Azotobacter beijerinckii]MDV7212898.1 hypothetical protein [Azotobacter beijerinckii]